MEADDPSAVLVLRRRRRRSPSPRAFAVAGKSPAKSDAYPGRGVGGWAMGKGVVFSLPSALSVCSHTYGCLCALSCCALWGVSRALDLLFACHCSTAQARTQADVRSLVTEAVRQAEKAGWVRRVQC